MNTLFGPDISSYQHGLNLNQVVPRDFVLAKVTEGTYYIDGDYDGWRQQAAALGDPFVWYHFLSGEDPAAQVAHVKAHIGDPTLPGMLDFEPTGTYRPTFAQLLAFADAAKAKAAGLRLRLVYLPHWYWVEIGSPDLTPLAARGLLLVSSSYPGGGGVPISLYPGDGFVGWDAYGGMTPTIYQYTDRASAGGQLLDYNAFRGDRAQLLAALNTTPQGGLMALTDQQQAEMYNFANQVYHAVFFGGPSCGEIPPGHADNSLVSKTDYLIDQAKKTLDLNALATALAPLLHPTTDIAALAQALAPHLPGAVDPAAVGDALAAHFRIV